MSEIRTAQKEKVIEAYDRLIDAMDAYMILWKLYGGGTTGHLIGSSLKRLNSLRKLWIDKA
jgi:hypothetical protein